MGVRDRVFCLAFVCSHSLGVARRYADFVYRVVDGCLVCILRKFCPGVCPVVCLVQHYRIPTVLSVCFQLYSDACCSQAVLVVSIRPDFSYTHTGLFRCVFIGQGCNCSIYTGVCQAVAFRHASFNPGVCDVCSVCFLRKVLYCCCPVIICCQGDCIYNSVSIHQVDAQTLRSLSILIIAVVPYFSDSCFCCLLCIGISNYKSICCISSYFCYITIYRIFTYRIYDFSFIFILWKIFKTIRPAPICCYNFAFHFCSICKKSHCNAIWSLFILVVIIVPYFSTTYSYFLWISTIGYCNIGITINTYCFKSTLV